MKKCTIVIAVLAGYFIIAWGLPTDHDNDSDQTSVISYAGDDLKPDHPTITAPSSVWFPNKSSSNTTTDSSLAASSTKNGTDTTTIDSTAPDDDNEYYSETSDDEYYFDDPVMVAPSNGTVNQMEGKSNVSSRSSLTTKEPDLVQEHREDKPKSQIVGKMLVSNVPVDNSNFRKAFEYFEASWKRSTLNGTDKPIRNENKVNSKIWQRPKVGSNPMNSGWRDQMVGVNPINGFTELSSKNKHHWHNRFDINEAKSGLVVNGIPDILNDQSDGSHSTSPGSSSLIGSTFEHENRKKMTSPSLLTDHGSMERSSTYNDPYGTRPLFIPSPVYNRFDNDVFRPFPFSARDEQRFPDFQTASMESSQQKPFISGGTFRLDNSDVGPSSGHPGPRPRKRKRKRRKEGSRNPERGPTHNEDLPSPHFHPFIDGINGNEFHNYRGPGSSYAHQMPFSFNFRSPAFFHHGHHINSEERHPAIKGHSNEERPPPSDFGLHSHHMMASPALPIVAPPTNGLPPVPIPMQAHNRFLPMFIPTEQAIGNTHLANFNRGVVTYVMDRVRQCKYPGILSFLNPDRCKIRHKKFVPSG